MRMWGRVIIFKWQQHLQPKSHCQLLIIWQQTLPFKLSSYFIMDGYSVFIVLTEQAVNFMCG